MSSKYNKTQYIFLQGGLGNQLYILAYADFLKQKGFENVKLIAPYKKTKGDTKDKKKRSLITELPDKMNISLISLGHRYIYSILFRLPKIPLYKSLWSKIIRLHIEPSKGWAIFQPEINNLGWVNVHFGYYQSYHYISDLFKQQVREITDELSPKKENTFRINQNDVAIHIRRGDFLIGENQNIFNTIGIAYYLNGLKNISKKIEINKIYIFSDDFKAIEDDIKTLSQQYEVELVEGQSVLEDFVMLQQFSNFVIGNSTFSWWAAMLSNANNIVVPKTPWKVEMENMTPYPPNWIKIEN
jgi:putative glycosyltransferase